jgi:hypothetical protein
MVNIRKAVIAVAFCQPWALSLADDNPATFCKEAAKRYEEGDIAAAIEEAKWCLEGLEQIAQGQKTDAFPVELAGWKRGQVEQHKAMGFSSIETLYSRDGKQIRVNFTSGSGQMAAMFGQIGMAGAGRKIRLGRYAGTIIEEGTRIEVMISLKMTPGMISLETSDADMDEMTEFAKALPVADIDQ